MFKLSIRIFFILAIGLSACSQPSLVDPGLQVSPTVQPAITLEVQLPAPGELPGTTISPTVTPIEPTQMAQSTAVPASQEIEKILDSSLGTPSYRVQAGTPVAMANFIQPEAGCNFLGVGGQPFNLSGQPVLQLVVEVGGSLAGSEVFHLQLSGNFTNLGPGGFLITLSDHPIESNGSLWILLYDLAGQPLTDKVYFSTFNDCARNFIMINFVEVDLSADYRINFPLIFR